MVCGCAQNRALPTAPVSVPATVLIKASPKDGFYFPYLLRLPPQTNAPLCSFLLVEPNNSGHVSNNLEEHIAAARSLSETGVGADVSRRLSAPLLMPAFPRSKDLYTHSLNRRTLVTKKKELRRLDLQLLAMIADACRRLEKRGIQTDEKVLMTGFSASGAFVNRFTALHPEKVQASAVGAVNGILILPLRSLGATPLPFPLGVADLAMFGKTPFQFEEWKRVPQFNYMGAADTNDAVQFDDAYTEGERKIIYELLGERMQPDRWERCQALYREAGASASFKTYQGIGHGTNGRIHSDIAEFFQNAMAAGQQ